MQVQDILSLAFMGIILILAPIAMVQSWSSIDIGLKSPVEGCSSMFQQTIGLNWATQCNCDPGQGKFICDTVNLEKLPPQYSFLPMGGLLLQFVFGFSIAGTLLSVFFIIYKGKTPDTESELLNYKPYVSWIISYTMVLFLTATLVWSLFMKVSLDTQHGGKSVYANGMGWTLCVVCVVLSSLSAILQLSQPNNDEWDDIGDYYDEGDAEGDYSEFSESDSGG